MAKVNAKRENLIAMVEEIWCAAELDGKLVDVHGKVFQSLAGPNTGKFAARAHLHSPGGGHMMISSGRPNLDNAHWFDRKEAAISAEIDRLEQIEDPKFR